MNSNSLQGTYYQTPYIKKPQNSWVIPYKDYNIFFKDSEEDEPTVLLVESILKAIQDRESGKASPVFSSVKEMKEWFEKQNE